ncbi:hypothetical protein H1R20_g5346, partial [Candolleomyces eurysporus]
MITFTPVAGAANSTSTTPLAYLLQVDDVRILLDCGSPDWVQEPSPFNNNADSMDTDDAQKPPPWQEYCDTLKEVSPLVDLVLLSHGDLAHCGLYPWAYARWGLKAPAYTTLPVQAMGKIAVMEDVDGIRGEIDVGEETDEQQETEDVEMDEQSKEEGQKPVTSTGAQGRCIPTVIEVQDAFEAMNTLRYSQPIHLQGKCQGLTITAFSAGHTLGGTIWKIRSPSSGTILYAVNVNHMKERHLDGTVLMMRPGNTIFDSLVRPDLLITDAERVSVLTSRRKDRDAALIEGTLSRALFDYWNEAQRGDTWDKGKIGRNVMMDGSIKLKMYDKVPLQGAELEAHLQKERAAKEKEAAQQAAMARNQRMLEADEGDSDSDSDTDDEREIHEALGGDMDSDDDDAYDRPSKRSKRKGANDGDEADWGESDEVTKQLLSFDIFLKGKVSKSTSFFKSVGGQTQRFRMFPYVDKRRRVDEYGETIDVGMWLRKGKALEEEAENEENEHKKTTDDEEKLAEPPSKYVDTEVEVQLACRLLFIDMEGLNDGRAVKTIVPQIIVHASTPSTQALIESCGSIKSMTKDIFAPSAGETIQIGQQVNNFSISISDNMLKSLRMSRFEDNEIAYVRGRIVAHSNSTIPILEPTKSGSVSHKKSAASSVPLAQRKLGSRPQVALPHSTMIGELKLTALKARLASIGVHAELVGEGVLICGPGAKPGSTQDELEETVAVKKLARGKVELEGNVSDIYYTVRREIYNLHALVAAI